MPIVNQQGHKVRTAMVQFGSRRFIHIAYRDMNGEAVTACGHEYDHQDYQIVRGFNTDQICETCIRRASREHIVGQGFAEPIAAASGD